MKAAKFAALSLLLAVLLGGCGPKETPQEKYQRQVFAMDTVMILTAYGETEAEAQAALDAAEEKLLALEADLDPENSGGSVYRVNAAPGQWMEVSEDCLAIALTAREAAEATGGAMEPKIYPLTKLWGFTDANYYLPAQWEIDECLSEMRSSTLEIDKENSALRLSGGEIAYGAVAKGYAAEAAIGAMEEAGADYAIVSLGGNVQSLGEHKPDGSLWQVAVTDPADPGDYLALLSLGEKAVVTSGGYQRYFEYGGHTYIHILDPMTGWPVENGLSSVTVVCDDGVMADALSTSLFILGEQGALNYYDTYGGCELVLVTEDDRVIVTPGLRDSLEESSAAYTFEYYGAEG